MKEGESWTLNSPPPLDSGTPVFAGFLHSGPSKGPDCRKD